MGSAWPTRILSVIKTVSLILFLTTTPVASYNTGVPSQTKIVEPSTQLTRRNILSGGTAFAAATLWGTALVAPAQAFSGSGSAAYSGRDPASKSALQKSYKDRVVADVTDFRRLGKVITSSSNIDTKSDVWVAFFIPFARVKADAVGRTYAALIDLIGTKEEGGGCGRLLAASFSKPNKPPDNLPSVKAFKPLESGSLFYAIKAAAEQGDVAKTKEAYDKAAVALSAFLKEVELPPDLSDPIYN